MKENNELGKMLDYQYNALEKEKHGQLKISDEIMLNKGEKHHDVLNRSAQFKGLKIDGVQVPKEKNLSFDAIHKLEEDNNSVQILEDAPTLSTLKNRVVDFGEKSIDYKIAVLTDSLNQNAFAGNDELNTLLQYLLIEMKRAKGDLNADKRTLNILQDDIIERINAINVNNAGDEIVRVIVNISRLTRSIIEEEDNIDENIDNVAVAKGEAILDKFEHDLADYNRLLDENPMYTESDKLIRRLGYYRAYETKIDKKCKGRLSSELTHRLMSFRKQIDILQTETETFSFVGKHSLDRIRQLEENLERATDDAERERISVEINELKNILKTNYSTAVKDDVLDMDDSSLTVNNWKADKTLDPAQIKAVSEIDAWMLSKATDEYKDKVFMQEVLGCTVRQRLAMYICIERGIDKMDEATLIFSQANYLPDINEIKSEMRGWSFFRFAGVQRIHWSKMRRAFEYVTANRDFMDTMAADAMGIQVNEYKEETPSYSGDIEETKVLIDDHEDSNLTDDNKDTLRADIMNSSAVIIEAIQHIRNTSDQEERNILVRKIGNRARTLKQKADRLEELEKGTGLEKGWYYYKKAINTINSYVLDYTHFVGETEMGLRTFGDIGETVVSNWFDYFSAGNLFVSAGNSLLKEVLALHESYKNWGDMSASGKLKDAAKHIGSVDGLAASSMMIYTMISKYNLKPEGFNQFREDIGNAMKKSIAEHGKNEVFGVNVFNNVTQVIGTAVTASTVAIDVTNAIYMKKSANSIKAQIEVRAVRGLEKQ